MDFVECPLEEKLDPRVRRSRKLLEDSFKALMRERPYSEISVGDIAERATVNRATFYAHYVDKNDLAQKMLRHDLLEQLLAVVHHQRPFSSEALSDVSVTVFRFIEQLHGGCGQSSDTNPVDLGPIIQATIQEFVKSWFELDVDAKRYFPNSSLGTISTVLSWTIYGAASNWVRTKKRPAAEATVREMINLLLR